MRYTTLCYIENPAGEYLMLHRVKKENDCNRDKWIGIGGKFEDGESPEECVLREIREETGLTVTGYRYRGIVTFVSDRWETEYMHLFTADAWTGSVRDDCDEGPAGGPAPVGRGPDLSGPAAAGGAVFLPEAAVSGGDAGLCLPERKGADTVTILVSACLLGVPCRYDGQSKAHPLARALCEKHHVVPVCGEIFGGLPTPRPPAEIQGDRVVTRDGRDVTEAYRRGAEAAAQLARLTGAQAAVLKERSPSCGSGAVYDGTFSGVLTEGWGVAAGLLREQGIRVLGESRLEELLRQDVR